MVRRKSYLAVYLVILLAISLSCEKYDAALDGSSDDANAPYITDGTQTTAYPSVGYLENGGIFCSATLIGSRAVLTAGHCIASSSGNFNAGGKSYRWSKAHVHPNYNSGNLSHDVAVVILNDNVSGVTPSPINTSSVSKGQQITLVGFGYTNNSGGNSSGKKYVGTNTISSVNNTEILYKNNSTICNGDSGGPSFVGNKVAGVHSWGQGNGKCTEGTGGDKRVDYYASWIKSVADVSTGGGDDETCSDKNNYVDAQGFDCVDWVGYDCTRAAEDWGYSNAEEQEIIANCPQSCELCSADNCPNDPNKSEPGICGCGKPDTDSDGDGTADCRDNCPDDPSKTQPGECGCGKPEGTCNDSCEDKPGYIDPQGFSCPDWVGYDCARAAEDWGYSNAEENEIKANCPHSCELCFEDNCPNDPNKTQPGICGCGNPDSDSDSDGTANCKDNCPNDPSKTEPGECGCGKPEGTCSDSCEDKPGFFDAQGYSCAEWVGYDCNNGENWGYSKAEEEEIKASCPQSCGLCSSDDDPDDPDDGTGLRFVVYGDSRTNPDQHQQVVNGIASFDPELVLHSGDIWDDYSSSEWRSHITRHGNLNDLLQKNLYLVSRGNHESVSEVVNFKPSIVRNNNVVYSLSKGNVFFVSLGMDPSSARSFLSNALKSSAAQNATWKVVFSHYPIYSAGSHGENGVSSVESIFDQYGVDLFYCGHDHHYERSHQIKNESIVDNGDNLTAGRGTVYTVTGGGGAPLYGAGSEWWTNTARNTRHYIGVVATDTKLVVQAKNSSGSTIDSFTISK